MPVRFVNSSTLSITCLRCAPFSRYARAKKSRYSCTVMSECVGNAPGPKTIERGARGPLGLLHATDAVEERVAARRLVERREDAHRRRLARAVRSDEADHFSRTERERHVVERGRAAEFFSQTADFNSHARSRPSTPRAPS